MFARCGVIDPLSLDDYRRARRPQGPRRARSTLGAEGDVEEVIASGLRGRGGAGFPTGIKWRTVAGAEADQKYIVCNADEGDSGTFADRMLMEGDPFLLIEGMAIAGLAVGATQGLRLYPLRISARLPQRFRAALERRARGGLLGAERARLGRAFDIEARLGAGAYICGEETSLLESLEGKRGQVRAKPPLPAISGPVRQADRHQQRAELRLDAVDSRAWRRRPTPITASAARAARSRSSSPATSSAAASSNSPSARRSASWSRISAAARARAGRSARCRSAARSALIFRESLLDTPLDYEAMLAAKGMLGHGGIVVFDDSVDMARQARFAFEFCAKESCGKCTPCRIGSTRGVETVDKIIAGRDRAENVATAARSLRDDDRRLALRARRPDAAAGAERARPFPRGFRSRRSARVAAE